MSKETKKIQLETGLVFDYQNMMGEGGVTEADVVELGGRLQDAHRAIETMRESGIIRGHLSKDGEPEKVLFSQLPYVKAGNLNNPESIKRLKEFSRSLQNRIDAVISFGIGGSYLGNKVLFDLHCGEFWNYKKFSQFSA